MTALALLSWISLLPPIRGKQLLRELEAIPAKIETNLQNNEAIKAIAQKYSSAKNFFFLGRQACFPVALEGALKLKEISYIHAEGYPAAEMKHGPIALIEEETPSVIIVPSDSMRDKTLRNLEVVRARRGPIIALATEGDDQIRSFASDVIYVPQTLECLTPLLSIIPLQRGGEYCRGNRLVSNSILKNFAFSSFADHWRPARAKTFSFGTAASFDRTADSDESGQLFRFISDNIPGIVGQLSERSDARAQW